MGYTLLQIGQILAKADKTMYKIGNVAYDDMFSELDEKLDYERDIIYIYKRAVEYGDDFYVGTDKLDTIVEKLGAKVTIYDYGSLNPIYSDALSSTSVLQYGAVLNDLNDVTITNLQNNQILKYNASLGQWVNTGTSAAIRSSQSFTAALNQTVFTTASPFDPTLLDVFLNGVRLNTSSYTTFGEYQITLADGCLADDIIDVLIYDPTSDIVNGDLFMTKAVYDTDNDGIVDDAEKITIIARNSTGATIHKGKIVYLQGSTGNRPNMLLAQANSEATSSKTFGVVVEDVANNADGQVAAIGTLHDLDTRSNATNPFTTDTLVDGDLLWLSATNPGYVTKTPPTQPNHTVFIGVVARTTPSFGRIIYKIQNGFELQELHNVLISSVADKDTLYYDLATGLWKNTSKGAWLGGSASQFVKGDGTLDSNTYLTTSAASAAYVPQSRTITINGTSYDLSADRSWNIVTGGTVTSVALSVPTGLVVTSGSPITTSGTIAVGLQSGYSIPTTVKQGNWDDAYTFVSAFPSQTGNSGKYLTTDGSTLSWGTVSTANIYNSDGTLTGDRTVNSGGFTLSINPVTTFNNQLNQQNSVTESGGSTFIYSNKLTTFNFTRTNDNVTSLVHGDKSDINLVGTSANSRINATGYYSTVNRSSASDISTYSVNALYGFYSIINQSSANKYSGLFRNFYAFPQAYQGTVNEVEMYRGFGIVGTSSSSATVNNYTGVRISAQVGWSSGAFTGLITNYYGILLDTPTVNATGTITNRWGVYAPDGAMKHHLQGNLILGSTVDAGFKLDVQGTMRIKATSTSNVAQLVITDNASSSNLFNFSGDGAFYVGKATFPSYIQGDANGGLLIYNKSDGNSPQSYLKLGNPNTFGALNNHRSVEIQSSVNVPLSTSVITDLIFTGTINISSTGIGRAVYVNKVITSGDFRAFESTTGGAYFNTSSVAASAILQADSTSKGFLQPRMTGTQRDAITTPATGLSVYNTTTNTSDFYNGTSWVSLAAGNIYTADGTLTGNRTVTANGNSLTFLGGNEVTTGEQRALILQTSATNKVSVELLLNNTFTTTGKTWRFRSLNGGDFDIVTGTSRYFYIASDGKVVINSGTAIASAQFSVSGTIASNGGIQVQGGLGSPTGAGIEFEYSGGTSYFTSYNRGTSAWLPIVIRGSQTDFYANNSNVGRIYAATGNWRIQTGGTFADDGYKLDVQGTGRFTGKLLTTSAEDDFGGTSNYVRRNSNNLWFYSSTVSQGGIGSATGTNHRSILLQGVYSGYSADAVYIGTSTTAGTYFQNTYMKIGGLPTTYTATAILELESITRGFLPPRMTETQKNAISTPATGLIVYQTDGTEGLYENTSTGWRILYNTPSGGSGITRSVNNISTTTTAAAAANTDYVYLISGTTTLTLPTAAGNTNRYTLKNVGTGTVTINTTSSQTIDGSTSITMAVRYTALDVISDGTNWNII